MKSKHINPNSNSLNRQDETGNETTTEGKGMSIESSLADLFSSFSQAPDYSFSSTTNAESKKDIKLMNSLNQSNYFSLIEFFRRQSMSSGKKDHEGKNQGMAFSTTGRSRFVETIEAKSPHLELEREKEEERESDNENETMSRYLKSNSYFRKVSAYQGAICRLYRYSKGTFQKTISLPFVSDLTGKVKRWDYCSSGGPNVVDGLLLWHQQQESRAGVRRGELNRRRNTTRVQSERRQENSLKSISFKAQTDKYYDEMKFYYVSV